MAYPLRMDALLYTLCFNEASKSMKALWCYDVDDDDEDDKNIMESVYV